MSDLEFKYGHQGISVENMEESIKWYSSVFDVRKISDEHSRDFGAPLQCRVVHLLNEYLHFELFEYDGPDGKIPLKEIDRSSVTTLQNCGNKHVCYETNIPEFVYKKLLPNNVFIDHGPERQGENWQLFIRDPNGIMYEFHDIGGARRDPHAFDDFPCKLFD